MKMKLKKLWQRAAAYFLAGAVLLGTAGCGAGGGKEGAKGQEAAEQEANASLQQDGGEKGAEKGRYMERMIDSLEDVSEIESLVRLKDGSIAFINPSAGSLMLSKDNGNSWETKELPALAAKTGIEELEITSRAVAPDGGVFFSYVDWSKTASKEEGEGSSVNEVYVYIDSEGNDSEVTLTNTSGSFFYLSDAVFTGDRTLVGMMNGGAPYWMDLDAGTLSVISAFQDDHSKICVAGNYLLSDEVIYGISDSDTVDDSVLKDFIKQETTDYKQIAFCYDAEENKLYSASAGGLYGHVLEGSTMENMLDGGLCAMGDPTKKVAGILKNDDGSFLVAFDDGELDLYAYDEEAPSVPTEQLTVYSLNQNMTVSKAISMFRKSNPDVYVKQEIGLLGDYGVTKEDAIRNLNTRLLAGDGPDIILLDEMPLHSYIEKGVLMDLGDLANELEGNGAYFSNILRAYENDGGLYAIPIRFQIPILLGAADQMRGIKDMASLADAVNNVRKASEKATTVFGAYTAEELLKRLYMFFSYTYMDGDGVDADAIRLFLEQASAIYEAEKKNVSDEKLQQHQNSMVWMEEYGQLDAMENFSVNASGMYEMIAGEQLMMIGKIRGMTDFQMAEAMLDNKEGMAYDFMDTPDGGLFVPYGIAGISEKTEDADLAVSFLKELMGQEVQKADLEDGFPVNADAYEIFTQTNSPDSTIGFSASVADEDGNTTDRVTFSATWPSAEEIASMKEKIGTLGKPALSDDVVFTAVLESGVKTLEGDLAINEGCDQIVQKMELYLAE